MQYRYSESDFLTVVDYLKYKPQILGLFVDENAVKEDCYSKEAYIRYINVGTKRLGSVSCMPYTMSNLVLVKLQVK
jgi:hypothetical protein